MKKQNLLFIHQLLKAIGDSIIMVFIPLYVLKQSNEFYLAILYLVGYSIFNFIFLNIFKSLIKKHGVICILCSFIFVISAQAVLSFATINIYNVLLVSLFMGLYQSLYSVPLNIIFTFGDKKANVGKFYIGNNIGKILFTLVSGFILSSEIKNSFLILAIASSLFYICSTIPLFICYKELKNDYKIHDYKLEKKTDFKLDKLFIIFHICFGIFQPVMDHLIPIYLYVNNLSFQAVTIVIVIIEIGKIIANYVSQKLVVNKKTKVSLIISSILFMTSILVLIFNKTPVILYIFSTLASLSFPLTFVPMFHIYCNYLKKNEYIFNGSLHRDIQIFSGRPILYALSLTTLGMIPSLLFGVISIPIMLYCGLKISNKFQ